MRTPNDGLERIRLATGANHDDPRLIAVRLDLDDATSIAAAGDAIVDRVGGPDALVHNAGIAGVGCVEEMPPDVFEHVFSTNLFGPVRLTKALLPEMRTRGRGRIVVVSSQGGVHGMPGISAYSAAKGALERWAESLYADLHAALERAGRYVVRIAAPPERFARSLHRALEDSAPFARRSVGWDAVAMSLASHVLPTKAFQAMTGRALGLPRPKR
jgi:NAD(P)-dependent dehydrogenase (short-subunit alcohol dehydrogenase family)